VIVTYHKKNRIFCDKQTISTQNKTQTKMKRTRNIYLDRFEKFISDIYFKDVNIKGKIYPHQWPVDKVSWFTVPDPKARPLFSQIINNSADTAVFTPFASAEERKAKSFGPSWSTHWFKLELTVPHDLPQHQVAGHELHLLWNSDTEAMIYAMDGTPLQGLTGGTGNDVRQEFIITRDAKPGQVYQFYVEMV